MFFDVPPPVEFEQPPAIVYEIPTSNYSLEVVKTDAQEQSQQPKEKQPISVMAFGIADPNLGVHQDNTKVHFYDHYEITKNARIAHVQGIVMQYSSMILPYRGHSSVTVEFNLGEEHLTEDLGLYLTHLSSDLHRGTYDSAIKILVNGQMFVEKYVPASHDWIKNDRFDLSACVRNKILKPGANTVEIRLHDHAISNYWIHCIKVM